MVDVFLREPDTFTDAAGFLWRVRLDPYRVGIIDEVCGVDLTRAAREPRCLEELAGDHHRFIQVLYQSVKTPASSPESFVRTMGFGPAGIPPAVHAFAFHAFEHALKSLFMG